MILVIVCFDDERFVRNDDGSYDVTPPTQTCDIFNGSNVSTSSKYNDNHAEGGLGLYNGKPTAVGGGTGPGVETLTEDGWIRLAPHPRLSDY